ncbi:MAG: 50S ribosomal protein L32e [Candidatus Pacearchaeota archaeon]|nr:50S ribosomal protein L32e [Candidatus Pacearchaeota archaeon]
MNKKPNFLRRTWSRYAKLGKGVKKNQKWRRPSGRDNKMREKRRGYPAVIEVGYKNDRAIRGMLNEKNPVTVMNINDLEKIGKNDIAVIGNIGKKKKLEIAKVAKEKKIEIYNMNAGKFLRQNKKPEKKKTDSKENKEEKK